MLLWRPFSPRMAVAIKLAPQSVLNSLTRTCSEMPLLKLKGHSYADCTARHCQLSQGSCLLWQWQELVDLKFGNGWFPSEKHGEETGSGEGESCRPFQHLSLDTALLLPAALPQGTWCRKTTQLEWEAVLARALWQQSEECYLWQGLYITIFVHV